MLDFRGVKRLLIFLKLFFEAEQGFGWG